MRKQKAKQWELISEGIVSIDDINRLLDRKQKSIVMPLLEVASANSVPRIATVDVVLERGPVYNVMNNKARVNKKPFKYLSCAIRRAVKEYKAILRTGKWKCIVK